MGAELVYTEEVSEDEAIEYSRSVARAWWNVEVEGHQFCVYFVVRVMVRSMNVAVWERVVNSQVSPMLLINVWKLIQFCSSIALSSCINQMPKPLSMNRRKEEVFLGKSCDVCLFEYCDVKICNCGCRGHAHRNSFVLFDDKFTKAHSVVVHYESECFYQCLWA